MVRTVTDSWLARTTGVKSTPERGVLAWLRSSLLLALKIARLHRPNTAPITANVAGLRRAIQWRTARLVPRPIAVTLDVTQHRTEGSGLHGLRAIRPEMGLFEGHFWCSIASPQNRANSGEFRRGEVAEWSMAVVLKPTVSTTPSVPAQPPYLAGTVDDFVVRESPNVPLDSTRFTNLLNGCELQIGAKSIDPRKLEICLLSRGSQVQ